MIPYQQYNGSQSAVAFYQEPLLNLTSCRGKGRGRLQENSTFAFFYFILTIVKYIQQLFTFSSFASPVLKCNFPDMGYQTLCRGV